MSEHEHIGNCEGASELELFGIGKQPTGDPAPPPRTYYYPITEGNIELPEPEPPEEREQAQIALRNLKAEIASATKSGVDSRAVRIMQMQADQLANLLRIVRQ